MFELIFYSDILCTDAIRIAENVRKHKDLSDVIKNEIIAEIKTSKPECKWDAND